MQNAIEGFWEICENFRHFSVIARRLLCAKAFMESTLLFWEYMIEIFIYLIVEKLFIYLRQIRQDVRWAIVFNIISVFLFWKLESRLHFLILRGRSYQNTELLKLWKINSEKISMLSLIIFIGISLSWQALFYLDYGSLVKSYFLFQN